MSVVPRRWPLPAPQVAEAIAAMYCGKRERPLPVLVRDKLGEWGLIFVYTKMAAATEFPQFK